MSGRIEFEHNGKEYCLTPEEPTQEEALENALVYSIRHAANNQLVKRLDFGFAVFLSLHLQKNLKINDNRVYVYNK